MSWVDKLTRTYSLYISVEGLFIGIGTQIEDDESWFAYCPNCAKIWARGLVNKEETKHYSKCVPCKTHGGGSLLTFEHSTLKLPDSFELMQYELNLYLEAPDTYATRRGLFRAC